MVWGVAKTQNGTKDRIGNILFTNVMWKSIFYKNQKAYYWEGYEYLREEVTSFNRCLHELHHRELPSACKVQTVNIQ